MSENAPISQHSRAQKSRGNNTRALLFQLPTGSIPEVRSL